MEGDVVCLDNEPKTIEKYFPIIEQHGYRHELCPRPLVLGEFCERQKANPTRIKAFVLDLHDPLIKDLSEIRLPKVRTWNGEAVGLAVAEAFLKKPGSAYRDTPIAFLTGYPVHSKVQSRIDEMRKHNKVEVIHKTKGLRKFARFIASLSKGQGAPRLHGDVEAARLSDFDVAKLIVNELGFKPKQVAAIFGFHSLGEFEELVRRNIKSIDIDDRVSIIIDIKSRLDSIFGMGIRSQINWLKRKQSLLAGRSPYSLLKSGHMDLLACVLGLLQKVTG